MDIKVNFIKFELIEALSLLIVMKKNKIKTYFFPVKNYEYVETPTTKLFYVLHWLDSITTLCVLNKCLADKIDQG